MSERRADSAEFWSDFSSRVWGREAVALADFCVPPLDEDELFRLAVRCCDPTSAACGIQLQVFFDGKDQAGSLDGKYLPQESDGGFAGFDRRMKAMLGGADYCFFIMYPEALHFPLWDWSRRFLARLYEHVGIDNLGAYQSIFFGDYRKTPFGIHCDHEDIFQIPILGRKVLRCWPAGYDASQEGFVHSLDYGKFLPDSFLLEGRRGDVLYWPSQTWHVAESPGELTASLSLGLCRSDHDIPFAERLLEEIVEAKWDDLRSEPGPRYAAPLPFETQRLRQHVRTVPAPLGEAARRIREWLDERRLRSTWLRLATGGGFLRAPQPREGETITAADTIRRPEGHPLAWIPAAEGEVEVSVNGLSTCVPADPRLEALLERLDAASTVPVADLLAGGAVDGPGEERWTEQVCGLLTELWQFRGIERVTAPEAG